MSASGSIDLGHMGWTQTVELSDGRVTPGKSLYSGRDYDRFLLPGLTGLSVADLGTLDGFWAIESKKKGAGYIEAFDLIDKPTARLALSGHGIAYNTGVNLNLPQTWAHRFSAVLFFGVLYHLNNPVQGLKNAFDLVNPGGWLIVESEVDSGMCSKIPEEVPALWVTESLIGFANDGTNYFIPNRSGLRRLCLNIGGLEISSESTIAQSKNRMTIRLKKL